MQVERVAEQPVELQRRLMVTHIESPKRWVELDLAELWRFRQIAYFLAWRDVKVRYKQTALGIGWAILQPVLTTVVFTVFFGHVAKVSSGDIPYPLFVFTALLPWTLFASGVTQASNSLVGNTNLITKVYLPRLALPVAAIAGTVLDFLLSVAVLVVMLAYYGVDVAPRMVLAPAFVALAFVAAIAVGTLLAAANVRYRDVRFVVPFLVQIWLFASPVAYETDAIHGTLRTLYGINPMAGAISGFRWALLGGTPPGAAMVAISLTVSVVALALALVYFRRLEISFADVI
ncbi:MAG TPA: ABC transporter permease [Gaiellaceae bacterium]|nr:ABC transporter permease [Gaiellaceae bacterium]